MAIPIISILTAVGSKVLSKVVEVAVTKLLSEKVIIRVLIAVGDKLFGSTKNKLDDAIWKNDIKPELLKEITE